MPSLRHKFSRIFDLSLGFLARCIAVSVLCFGWTLRPSEAAPVRLAADGKTFLAISLPKDSDPILTEAGQYLALILGKICAASFEVVSGSSPGPAIFLGTRADFPEILNSRPSPLGPEGREGYRLLSERGSLWIVGETPVAVRDGVFDLLHSLGYRQYFPTPVWEFIPETPQLVVDVDRWETPAFLTRSFFQTNRKVARKAFSDWEKKNRVPGSFVLETVGLLRPSGEALKNHPEWFTSENPKGSGLKPIVDKAELCESVRRSALEQVHKDPPPDTLGLSPTDGGGWPTTSAIGTPSDQLVYLANYILAEFNRRKLPTKLAFLAYHMQSQAPSLQLQPGAIVLVATTFIRGGHTPLELVRAWKEKGADVGIYEYLDNSKIELNLPGRSPASNLSTVRDSILKYHEAGARYWVGEAGSGWAPNGLGYYLTARSLWNPALAPTASALLNEFTINCFGAAQDPMRRFYNLLDGSSKPLLSEDLVARMYRCLEQALAAESRTVIRERILQLAAYTRFVELMHQYQSTEGKVRALAFQELERHTFACREMPMFDYHVVTRRPELADRYKKEQRALWNGVIPVDMKLTPVPTTEELEALVRVGVQANKLLPFLPSRFSENLVPLAFPDAPGTGGANFRFSKSQTLWWWAKNPGAKLNLKVSGGWRGHGEKRAIQVTLRPARDPGAEGEGNFEAILAQAEAPADQNWHEIFLTAKEDGLYRLMVDDGFNETEIGWPEGERIAVPSGVEDAANLRGRYSGCFVVPAGSDRVSGYSETAAGVIRNETDQIIYEFKKLAAPDFFDIPIRPSPQVRVFRLENASGKKLFMTVPPFLSRTPQELLIPSEVAKTPESPAR